MLSSQLAAREGFAPHARGAQRMLDEPRVATRVQCRGSDQLLRRLISYTGIMFKFGLLSLGPFLNAGQITKQANGIHGLNFVHVWEIGGHAVQKKYLFVINIRLS